MLEGVHSIGTLCRAEGKSYRVTFKNGPLISVKMMLRLFIEIFIYGAQWRVKGL